MKTDVTQVMVEEHKLILRMIGLVEANTALMEAGRFRDWQFFLDAVDFIRNFADRFHHAKEEDVLFTALVANGMPAQNSPVAAMLMAHDQGRAFVRGLEEAAQKALEGEPGQIPLIAENARGYAALLRDHIDKEDNILYPLAERVLPEAPRPAMVAAYAQAEAAAPAGLALHYQALVERYEAKSAA
jgi:hemerythrin-like domain-containing protein